ncbi:uncharacterized protein FIBRA_08818 [Fibroporia radiculosa]|uniref:F-box domain-containing protein n=1 Tax=Fibroporia radiculosa TaxID=599839 RepID=J4H5D4_9APHY|nr:uncharacterized protein FIBRA_08818 [Fibroporia radiculosa]CCM06544.1 predicted protein [Fibroporia radiculosa]
MKLEAEAEEMCGGNGDSECVRQLQYASSLDFAGADDKAESSGSIAKMTPSEASMTLEHSIQLPIELWEKVIDHLVDDDIHDRAPRKRELERVCRGWHARCRFRDRELLYVWDMDKHQMYRLINILRESPERCRAIKRVSFRLGYGSACNVGLFAVCMAQKLPRAESLRLVGINWKPEQLHPQVFVHVTLAFESVTMLELSSTMFPSALVFGRLVRALPRLSVLDCYDVNFEKHCDVASRIWERHPLWLDTANLQVSDDVVGFLVTIGVRVRQLSCYVIDLERLSELVTVSAESLSSLEVTFTQYVPPDPLVDLTLAANLHVLSFDFFDIVRLGQAASILSCASLPKLKGLRFNSSSMFDSTASFVQDKLDQVGQDSYARIDQTLSGRQYPALQKVTFQIQCRAPRSRVLDVISEVSLARLLSSRFPALHASGRLV